MNAKDKIKQQLANLKSQARDMDELNAIQIAFDLGREYNDAPIWIISAKIDNLYKEIIDKKYGK